MIRPLLVCAAALALLAGADDAAARDKRNVARHEPRIICGQTGCFEIPRGCTGELRRTGRSVVAVVICDKK